MAEQYVKIYPGNLRMLAIYVTTKRTTSRQEAKYETRTTLGIYQALNYSKPTLAIRLFYLLLPTFSPLLMVAGGNGVAWAKATENM